MSATAVTASTRPPLAISASPERAVPAELQSLGHRPGFFYLLHSMGLASSMGLGIALQYLSPQVTLLIFGLAVGVGILAAAPTLLRQPDPRH